MKQRKHFAATDESRAPGERGARKLEGGPTYVRRAVRSIGRATEREYCKRCGQKRRRCQSLAAKQIQMSRRVNPWG